MNNTDINNINNLTNKKAIVNKGPKRRQHCTLCKNHGIQVLKNGHVCKLKKCHCELCKLTTKAQIAMRCQQALWRQQGRELAKNRNFQMLGLSSRQVGYRVTHCIPIRIRINIVLINYIINATMR